MQKFDGNVIIKYILQLSTNKWFLQMGILSNAAFHITRLVLTCAQPRTTE